MKRNPFRSNAVSWSAALLLLSPLPTFLEAQGYPAFQTPAWQKAGGYTFEAGLASPAGGAVSAVWFSADGSDLYARTASGPVWKTADMEKWTLSVNPAPRQRQFAPDLRPPEAGARLVTAPGGAVYALGNNLFRSGDNGRSWVNLNGIDRQSVIGAGQNDVAVSPLDSQTIVVANARGVWASRDAGQTWFGLNETLPNLRLRRIESTGNGITAAIEGAGTVELAPGDPVWRQVGPEPDLKRITAALGAAGAGANVTAAAVQGETVYAGAADGRLWISRDGMASWNLSGGAAGGPIERIFIDPSSPQTAYVAAAAPVRSLLRTIDGGQFWDDITGNLGENPAHALVADRASGVLYAATNRGVFLARTDLNALGPVPSWTALRGLPDQIARDLNIAGTRLYAAVDGYGVYFCSTPQVTGAVRVVSAADLADRPAAPGALYSVVGQQIATATAGSLKIPVLASGAGESQIQVPFEATGTQISLTLDQRTVALPLRPVSPAIFLDKDGAPMVLDAETGLILESRATLRPGARIQVLATGLGRTTPAWPTAVPAPAENIPAVSAAIQVYLNRSPLEVARATLAPGYVGLYIVEVTLPVIADAGAADLYISSGGQDSNHVRVYLQSY